MDPEDIRAAIHASVCGGKPGKQTKEFTYFPDSPNETTWGGYDLLVSLGADNTRKTRTISRDEFRIESAVKGAARLRNSVYGPTRSIINQLKDWPFFDLLDFIDRSVRRREDDLIARLIKSNIAKTEAEARSVIHILRDSWSLQRGQGSVDFGKGYIRLDEFESPEGNLVYQFDHIIYSTDSPYN